MKIRAAFLIPVVALLFAACNDNKSPVQPTPQDVPPKFQAIMLPINENPPVAGAEAGGSGTVTITLNLTKDASGTITGGTVDFAASMTGFPNGTALTAAHIHPGAPTVNGGVLVSTGIVAGEVTMPAGSGTLTKTGVVTSAANLTQILANPGGFYFNIHTAANAGGVARGQLNRIQ
ncbi:MAG: CHRD domain-containing protein [Acidobacteriota bacterium]